MHSCRSSYNSKVLGQVLRKGITYSATKYWTISHYKWLNNLHFENEILQETFNNYYSRVRI
ncbi:hypothetical protein B1H38_00115 [Leptospira borgpetersenii serovar Ballum]|nr:hypothetical protein B1H38_00115 [Leptospira borgpetersenii serovar Ballum]